MSEIGTPVVPLLEKAIPTAAPGTQRRIAKIMAEIQYK
jgi:hypothetical protein